jgi:hypothetical protein
MQGRANSSVATRISAKLLNLARASRVDYAVLLRRYAFERLLCRVSQLTDRDAFVLKGAFLFYVWGSEPYRSTQDLDLLAFGSPSLARVRDVFHRLAGLTVEPADGLLFTQDTMTFGAAEFCGRRG